MAPTTLCAPLDEMDYQECLGEMGGTDYLVQLVLPVYLDFMALGEVKATLEKLALRDRKDNLLLACKDQ